MKEKEIRERIERFLKKTVRNVVVPASVGLSLVGCDTHALSGGRADAGRDAPIQGADAADAATTGDLPALVLPYLVIMRPDADAQSAGADASSEASALPDAGPEVPLPPPPPPYLLLPSLSPSEFGRTVPLPLVPKKNG